MTTNRKVLAITVMLPVSLLLLTGCSGISASPSVSPASFFLPGLLKADPPQSPATSPEQLLPGRDVPTHPDESLAQS